MSLYGDYCPYCDGELEPDDVVELSDLRGEEDDICRKERGKTWNYKIFQRLS